MDVSRFHVVTVISNACRYKSRVRLYKQFAEHMKASGVQLWTVEAAFGNRPHEVTERGNPYHIQLRTNCEMWHKENMVNIGISRLPPDWDTVCWIDADVQFSRMTMLPTTTGPDAGKAMVADWAHEAWHQLQHHEIVQLWSTSCDMGPKTQTFATSKSFAYCLGHSKLPDKPHSYDYWHSGYAWAMRRSAFEKLRDPSLIDNGLFSVGILGAADYIMAWSLLDQMGKKLYHPLNGNKRLQRIGYHPNYVEEIMRWQEVAKRLNANIGVVEGTILHSWHGKKVQRQYNTRENILIESQYDPKMHIQKDFQGLWEWSPHAPLKLQDDIRIYHRMRDEDSNDM